MRVCLCDYTVKQLYLSISHSIEAGSTIKSKAVSTKHSLRPPDLLMCKKDRNKRRIIVFDTENSKFSKMKVTDCSKNVVFTVSLLLVR